MLEEQRIAIEPHDRGAFRLAGVRAVQGHQQLTGCRRHAASTPVARIAVCQSLPLRHEVSEGTDRRIDAVAPVAHHPQGLGGTERRHQMRKLVEFAQGLDHEHRRRACQRQLADHGRIAHLVTLERARIGLVKHLGGRAGIQHVHQEIGPGALHARHENMLGHRARTQALAPYLGVAPQRMSNARRHAAGIMACRRLGDAHCPAAAGADRTEEAGAASRASNARNSCATRLSHWLACA